MPAPLLWIGAAALSIYASDKANTAYLRKKGIVDVMPGDKAIAVAPKNGSVVCCGIYGVLDHTGIWVDGMIYELNGNGLVRCVSPERFLDNRSGSTIYVASDKTGEVREDIIAYSRAKEHLYSLFDYHLIRQNCHRFVAEMLIGSEKDITSFSDLNAFLAEFYGHPISWVPAKLPLAFGKRF